MNPLRLAVAVCGAAAFVAAAPPAAAQEVGAGLAMSTARAEVGSQRLSGVYIFASLDATAGPVRVWVSVPFATQRSTFDTFDPITGAPVVQRERTSGVSDPLLRADVRVIDDRASGLQFAVSAALKPAIVDAEAGLGTGATDIAFGASVAKTVGLTSIVADGQYWRYGDPEGFEFEDSLSFNVGVARIMGGGRWSSMASVSGFSKGIDGEPAPVQLNFAALALAGRRQSFSILAGIGLNSSASDFSIGAGWRVILRD